MKETGFARNFEAAVLDLLGESPIKAYNNNDAVETMLKRVRGNTFDMASDKVRYVGS